MTNNAKHTTIVEELKGGKTVTYFTVGCSMRPLLKERRTHVMIAPASNVKKRDIVLYVRKSGALILHRCMKIKGEFYFMRGDNTYGLEPIKKEQAIGVVTDIYRNGKCFSVENNPLYEVYITIWNIIYPIRWLYKKTRETLGWRIKKLLKIDK